MSGERGTDEAGTLGELRRVVNGAASLATPGDCGGTRASWQSWSRSYSTNGMLSTMTIPILALK